MCVCAALAPLHIVSSTPVVLCLGWGGAAKLWTSKAEPCIVLDAARDTSHSLLLYQLTSYDYTSEDGAELSLLLRRNGLHVELVLRPGDTSRHPAGLVDVRVPSEPPASPPTHLTYMPPTPGDRLSSKF